MSTFKVDNIQSSNTSPSVFRNVNGTEIGKLVRSFLFYNSPGTTVNSSFNISSVTKNGTGDFTVSFSISFIDSNYTYAHGVQYYASGVISGWQTITLSGTRSSGSIRQLTGSSASTVDCYQNDITYTR